MSARGTDGSTLSKLRRVVLCIRCLTRRVVPSSSRGTRRRGWGIAVSPCHLVLAILRVPESDAARILRQRGVEYDVVSELTGLLLRDAKSRAEIEERTPITLRPSHYELLDRLAEQMHLRESRRVNRQSLVLALMDAFAASSAPDQQFSSIEDLRDRVRQTLSPV